MIVIIVLIFEELSNGTQLGSAALLLNCLCSVCLSVLNCLCFVVLYYWLLLSVIEEKIKQVELDRAQLNFKKSFFPSGTAYQVGIYWNMPGFPTRVS